MLRRHFIAIAASAPGAGQLLRRDSDNAPQPRLWIDDRIHNLPDRPWRKVHLDFHNSQHIVSVGERFDAAEWTARLKSAHVNAVVVFAKDMHGYFYYPSRFGPVHPGLKRDLLGEQVQACRAAGIEVHAYYCTAWDNYLAERHPEWLVVKRDRTTYLPKFDQPPGWTALCIANKSLVDLFAEHAREFASRYELNGVYFDMPAPIAGECFCHTCLQQLRARREDPFDTAVQRRHKQALEVGFLDRLTGVVKAARPTAHIDYNSQTVFGLGERVRFMTNIDIEALPSSPQWGYYYFPLVQRYVRTFGVTTYGMTGRFHQSWADFGGLKHPAQMITEAAGIVANAARCDIGDQMPPAGRLDPAVYHVIGRAYEHVRGLEPLLRGAAPVAEAAMLVTGLPLDPINNDAHLGLTKLLIESRVQFDCVEPDAVWERYGLVVLPDGMSVDAKLGARLQAYVDAGGAALVCGAAESPWLGKYGFEFAGESAFKPAFMLPRQRFTGDIPNYEYALYAGAAKWRVREPAQVVADLGEPAFQRSGEHYTSHAQSPFHAATNFAAVATSGRVGLFAFPLGASYFNHGYWVYRSALQHVLRQVLPLQLLTSNAPVSAELEVTHQRNGEGHGERWLVHIVNWSANRSSPKHPVFHEEAVPLTNVQMGLRMPLSCRTARLAISGGTVPVTRSPKGVEVTVPRVAIHEVVVFEA